MGVESGGDEARRAFAAFEVQGAGRQFLQDYPNRPMFQEGTRVVSLEDGTGNALSARVNADNNLGAEARYGRTTVYADNGTTQATSQVLIAARTGRLTLTLQNLDDTGAVHFLVGGGTATTEDLMLGPGQMYSLPPGVAFEGAVSFISAGPGGETVSWVEYGFAG